MANRSRRFPPDYAITSRRKAEEDRRIFEDQTRSNRSLLSTALWEVNTTQRIERNTVKAKMDSMRKGIARNLEARRHRLAEKLEAEDQMYQQEIAGLQETTEQRAQRLKARARELVRRREAERRQTAKEQLSRQFRDNNDQFREIDSQRVLETCLVEREKALVWQKEAAQKQKEEDEQWHQQLLRNRDKMVEREESDKRAAEALREDMIQTLEKQLVEMQERRDEGERLKAEDARLMQERFDLDLEEAKRRDQARREMFERKKVEMNSDNARLRALKEEKLRSEREEDLRLLNAMLDNERRQETKEQAYKKRLRDQALEYRRQLQELMQKEAVSEAHANAIRAEEQEKAFRKREVEWEREKEYREALMREVLAVRKQQIRQQVESNRLKRRAALDERERLQQEMEMIAAEEKARAEDREFIKLENQRELLSQIEDNARRLQQERDLELMEAEAARRAEATYLDLVDKEMRTQRPLKNHGLKTFSWAT